MLGGIMARMNITNEPKEEVIEIEEEEEDYGFEDFQ